MAGLSKEHLGMAVSVYSRKSKLERTLCCVTVTVLCPERRLFKFPLDERVVKRFSVDLIKSGFDNMTKVEF